MKKKSIFQNQYVRYALIGLGVIAGFKVIGSIGKVVNTFTNPITGAFNNLDNAVQQKQTGLTSVEIALCQEVANNLDNAIWGNWGFDPFEDEGRIISELNRLANTSNPSMSAKVTSGKYREIKGRNLKTEVMKYLDSGERQDVDSTVLSNLI